MANTVEIKQNASGMYELWVNGARQSTGTKSTIEGMAQNYGWGGTPTPAPAYNPTATNISYGATNTQPQAPDANEIARQEAERQRQLVIAEQNRKDSLTAQVRQYLGAGDLSGAQKYFATLPATDQSYVAPTFGSNPTKTGGAAGSTYTNNQTTGTPGSTTSGTTGASSTNTGGVPLWGQTENQSLERDPLTQVTRAGEIAGLDRMLEPATVTKLMETPLLLAKWVHAITYGGYTAEDVVKDMKREELVIKGDPTAKNLVIINPELTKDQYLATPDGQKAISTVSTLMPGIHADAFANASFLKWGLNIPPEIFKTLVPLLDQSSQEFKDAVAAVKGTYYDLANAQLQASTEQEKAVADYNYSQFKKQIEEKYGIILSDNADKAWNQLESLGSTFNQMGLKGSGFEKEAEDDALRATMKADQRTRNAKLTDKEAKKAAYYQTTASSAEIAALTPEERAKYGLTPNASIASQFSLAALRAAYPDLTDAEIQAKHDAVLDENGNYRSTLYKNYYSGVTANLDTKRDKAVEQVITNASNTELAKGAVYDKSQPYSSTTASEAATLKSENPPAGSVTGTSVTKVPATPVVTPPPAVTPPAAQVTQDQISASIAQAKAMLAQTQAEGTKPFAGSSYDTSTKPAGTTTQSTVTTPTTSKDYSAMKPGETLDAYKKRIGLI